MSKLSTGVSVSANGCLPLRGLVMSWGFVHDVTLPLPYYSWQSLQQIPVALSQEEAGIEKEWMEFCYSIFLSDKTQNQMLKLIHASGNEKKATDVSQCCHCTP